MQRLVSEVLGRLDTMTTLVALMPKVAVALSLNIIRKLTFLPKRVVTLEPNGVMLEAGDK